MSKWKEAKEGGDHTRLELEDVDGWYKATVKWDGCVDFSRIHNVPLPITGEHPQIVDNIHYCDIDEEIERLQELRARAKDYFRNSWSV